MKAILRVFSFTALVRLVVLGVCCVGGHPFGLSAGEARADSLRYRYVSLDEATPPGFAFFSPGALTNSGRVYGTAFACGDTACVPYVAVYRDGTTTVISEQQGVARRGTPCRFMS